MFQSVGIIRFVSIIYTALKVVRMSDIPTDIPKPTEVNQRRKLNNCLSTLSVGELSLVILQHTTTDESDTTVYSNPIIDKSKLLDHIEECTIELLRFTQTHNSVNKLVLESEQQITQELILDLTHSFSELYQAVRDDTPIVVQTLTEMKQKLQTVITSVMSQIESEHTD